MNKRIYFFLLISIFQLLLVIGCHAPVILQEKPGPSIPASYQGSSDTFNVAVLRRDVFFNDPHLNALIDTALIYNQELAITLQDIEIAKTNIRFAQGKLSPMVTAGVGLGVEKVGRYTSQGAGDASAEITPGKLVPEILTNQLLGFQASWEVDIWGKLRTAKKAAFTRFLSSIEAKNWVITNLIAEIANNYYELLASYQQLEIIRQAIQLQQKEWEVVKIQRQAARVTELAVKQFEAQLFSARALEYNELQQIAVFQNNLSLLLGKFTQTERPDINRFMESLPGRLQAGIPSQMLINRPDIRQAELELQAARWDVKVARAEFLPSLSIDAGLGYNAFSPKYFLHTPESIFFSLAGGLVSPFINKNAITAEFKKASALQIQTAFNYQKKILTGYLEVKTQLSAIQNYEQSFLLKKQEVNILANAIDIASDLFKSSHANYLEVLTAQRDALEARLELVEVRKLQWNAMVNLYKSCGGGWQ